MQLTKTFFPNSAIFIEKKWVENRLWEKVHFCGGGEMYHLPHCLCCDKDIQFLCLRSDGKRGCCRRAWLACDAAARRWPSAIRWRSALGARSTLAVCQRAFHPTASASRAAAASLRTPRASRPCPTVGFAPAHGGHMRCHCWSRVEGLGTNAGALSPRMSPRFVSRESSRVLKGCSYSGPVSAATGWTTQIMI